MLSNNKEFTIDKLPFWDQGTVVRGFGRGSKDLGIPTANLDEFTNKHLESLNGVYYGFARILQDDNNIYQMVMSIGWNPFYHNQCKSAEIHILHHYNNDFYGSICQFVIVGYIRPEKNFEFKDELISEIHRDIALTKERLALLECEYIKSFDIMFPIE